jgi:Family of unknown function (DUF5681)
MSRYPYHPRNAPLKGSKATDGKSGDSEQPKDLPQLLPIQKTLLEEANRKLRVRSDGKDQEMTAGEAVLKKREQTALGGSTHAQNQLLRDLKEAQAIEQRNIAEEVAAGYALKHKLQQLQNFLTASGEDLKTFILHPDDVIVTEGVGYEIKGPRTQEQYETILKCCAARDMMYRQAVLEERLGPVKTAEPQEAATSNAIDAKTNATGHNQPARKNDTTSIPEPHDQTNPDDLEARWAAIENEEQQNWAELCRQPDAAAMYAAMYFDHLVPKRFRLTFEEVEKLKNPLRRMTTRNLLKEMHRLWRADGNPRPRGWRMPPFQVVETCVKKIYALVNDMDAANKTDTPMSEREIGMRLLDLGRG